LYMRRLYCKFVVYTKGDLVMKKDYVVFYLSADGSYYDNFTVSAVSFSDACKSTKSFSKQSGLSIMGVVEEKTLS
jgi:hypothetical protein